MGKTKIDKKLFHSKVLVFLLIFSFILLISTEAAPRKINFDSDKGSKPVVRVRKAGEKVPPVQKEHFERLIEDGKKLLLDDMDYEGAIGKFNEAKNLAITREQQAGALFYLSLAYFASSRETRIEDCAKTIRKLTEIDYYRELDELLCPPRYIELYEEIKREYGALKVQSKPAGADVYLNDSTDPVGQTPITIGSKAGTVRIRLKKGKKEKKDSLLVVAEKETTSPTYVLKGRSSLIYIIGGIVLAGGAGAALLMGKKGNGGGTPSGPTTGSIQVNSTPTGANIYLDGSDTGKTTNSILTDVSPGSHTVKLIKEGYEDYEENISVTAGQTATVTKTLTKNTITITSPSSSTIWTKGEEVEIKWETSGSISFQGINITSSKSRLASQRRDIHNSRFYRSQMRTRRLRGNIDLSKNGERASNKSSKFQAVSERFSADKNVDFNNQNSGNIGIVNKNNSSESVSLPLASGIFPQTFTSFGKMNILVITNVKIELYKGNSQIITIESSTENDGSYTWTGVDTSLEDGSNYKVRISCASDSEIYGESVEFTIEEKSITVTEPTSSTVWVKGQSVDIRWTSKGTIDYAKIELYKGNSQIITIASVTENDGSYLWLEVDKSLADGSNYKVRISCASDSEIYGESVEFTIKEKSITVTEPTSSTVWVKGQSADIRWTSKGTIDYVKIELYKSGNLVNTIASSTDNDGFFMWWVSFSSQGADYKVRVSCLSDLDIYDESDSFGIWNNLLTLYDGDSYDFSEGIMYKFTNGDFYYIPLSDEREYNNQFWANNVGQRGIMDMGELPGVDLMDVPIPSSGYSRRGVPCVINHKYVSLAQEGEEGYYIVFEVVSISNDYCVINWIYTDGLGTVLATPFSFQTTAVSSSQINLSWQDFQSMKVALRLNERRVLLGVGARLLL